MENGIRWIMHGKKPVEGETPAGDFGLRQAERVMAYHKGFSEYRETPLCELKSLSHFLQVQSVHVKDESMRFGLNAFKVLGSSYALACCIAERIGVREEDVSLALLQEGSAREKAGELTFVTATDGNHGRGVAWTAARLGHRSVVYLPKGSAKERVENIRDLGAKAVVTEVNYDDSVRLAAAAAEENGWILVQDTAWPGYTKIPKRIMQGYTTMVLEAVRQLGEVPPTHVFLQAGVGAMAGSTAAFLAQFFGEAKPVITIVEPGEADCLFRTACSGDGTLCRVPGEMDSIMAGLCCGEPCSIAWEILESTADCFVSIPDWVAASGMRILANPLPGDPRIISGESGAAAFGLAVEILRNPALSELKDALGIDGSSRILCFSTEGDTDRENYRRIVWDGAFSGSREERMLR